MIVQISMDGYVLLHNNVIFSKKIMRVYTCWWNNAYLKGINVFIKLLISFLANKLTLVNTSSLKLS